MEKKSQRNEEGIEKIEESGIKREKNGEELGKEW